MKKGFYFLFCCVFSLSAHAGTSDDCITALEPSSIEGFNQETANRLSEAIVQGDTDSIKKLAKPWLNSSPDYYVDDNFGDDSVPFLRRIDWLVASKDLLLFAAMLAIKSSIFHYYYPHPSSKDDDFEQTSKDVTNSLKTLVDMGFRFSAGDDSKKRKWAWYVVGESLTYFQYRSNLNTMYNEDKGDLTRLRHKEVLNILVRAGLTVESLYLSDGRSIVHEMLVGINPTEFENILDSDLITQDDINLPLSISYSRPEKDPYYESPSSGYRVLVASDHISPDYHDSALLHWHALIRDPAEVVPEIDSTKKLELLLEHGADPNLRVGVRNANSSKTTMLTPLELAKQEGNDPAVEVLLKAGAKEVY